MSSTGYDTIKKLITDVGNCARCGKDHKALTFLRLGRPIDEDTHWSICPETGEPILLRIERT